MSRGNAGEKIVGGSEARMQERARGINDAGGFFLINFVGICPVQQMYNQISEHVTAPQQSLKPRVSAEVKILAQTQSRTTTSTS